MKANAGGTGTEGEGLGEKRSRPLSLFGCPLPYLSPLCSTPFRVSRHSAFCLSLVHFRRFAY